MTRGEAPRALAPLLGAACAMALAAAIAPRVPLASLAAQDLSAVVLAVGLALAALHASSAVRLDGPPLWGALLASLAGVAAVWLAQPGPWAVPLQGLALLTLARCAGGAIGDRVQHPGHVMPATIVAAAADVASVLSPHGVTNAVSQSERALATLALAAPVPGTQAITYLLGIGDLVVMSLVLAAARKFEVSRARVTAALALGLAAAFLASALLERAIPALVPIAVASSAGVPAFRRLAPRDRKAAALAAALAAGVVALVALRR